jgi:hypothetical protein
MSGSNPAKTSSSPSNTVKRFAIPGADTVDDMMKEFSVSDSSLVPAGFHEWRKTFGSTAAPPKRKLASSLSSSALTFEDSRSASNGTAAVFCSSEESNHPFMRSDVSQDAKFADQDRDGCEEEEEMIRDVQALTSSPSSVAATKSGSQQRQRGLPVVSQAAVAPNGGTWVKKRFRYMVEGKNKSGHKRAEGQVMESAPEFDLEEYPTRVLIAEHIRRPKWGNKPFPPGLSPFTYQFIIYRSVKHVIQDLKNLPDKNRTLFTVAEENGYVLLQRHVILLHTLLPLFFVVLCNTRRSKYAMKSSFLFSSSMT